MSAQEPAIVFIHGLWLHATSWDRWVAHFAAQGFTCVAPGWPGEHPSVGTTRQHAADVADIGLESVTAHYAELIADLPTRPIVVGHSFGGLIAQNLLMSDKAVAAVAIDSAQMRGVLPLPITQLIAGRPVLSNLANRRRAVSLTPKQFRYGFANAVSQQESDDMFNRWSIPSPGRPVFEAAFARLVPNTPPLSDPSPESAGPLLLISGGKDYTVPQVEGKSLKQYRRSGGLTELLHFPSRGHSLAVDSGWREIADTVLHWVSDNVRRPNESV